MKSYLSLMILASTLIQPSYTRIGKLPWLWQSFLQGQGTTRLVKTRNNLGRRRENNPGKKVLTKETNGLDQNEKSEKYLKIMTIINKIKDNNKNQFVPLNILLNNKS